MKFLDVQDVIHEEQNYLLKRRQILGEPTGGETLEDSIGIASSGGGIRSATVNLGFINVLTRLGIFQKADYHSTVSGGGYTGSFIQATLRNVGSYDGLFSQDKIDMLRYGSSDYMKSGNVLGVITLIFGYLTGLCFSLFNPMIIFSILYFGAAIISEIFAINIPFFGFPWNEQIQLFFIVMLAVHGTISILLSGNLNVSKRFLYLEILTVALYLLANFVYFIGHFQWIAWWSDAISYYLIILVLLICIGFFTMPDTFSFGKYYQKQLADAFLRLAGPFKNLSLKDLHKSDNIGKEGNLAPYPLINTCVNFSEEGSDYFLLSPHFCGSKLTAYVRTDATLKYSSLSLTKAVGISAAAVNAGMGSYSSNMLNFMIALFNAGLGYLMPNPIILIRRRNIIWGPLYYFKILLSKMGSENALVNLSDGGHIENLGVYELLRRKCRLIICMDASADPAYTFDDLKNLIRRSRNELGIEISFRPESNPFEMIKPDHSGFSKKRFAIADLLMHWEKKQEIDSVTGKATSDFVNHNPPIKIGTFVYVKSSLLAPGGMPNIDRANRLEYETFRYKRNNYKFPHDATSDQSFSPVQWESYHQLGRVLAADIFGIVDLEGLKTAELPPVSRQAIIQHFDAGVPLPLSPVPAVGF